MPKSRAKTIRVYDLKCDACERQVRHEVEGPVERATPIREPFEATGDVISTMKRIGTPGGWRTISLKAALGRGNEREGFVCSDACAIEWATRNALPDPIAPNPAHEGTSADA